MITEAIVGVGLAITIALADAARRRNANLAQTVRDRLDAMDRRLDRWDRQRGRR